MATESSSETINKTKIYHGIFKPQLLPVCDEEDNDRVAAGDETSGGIHGDKTPAKKKKSKNKDSHWSKKQKTDPNAPSFSRIPLPELSDAAKLARQQALSEVSRRARLTAEKLPSICFYTILNATNGVCCCDISEDNSIMCAGFNDSSIRLWSINDQKIKPLKKTTELAKLDPEADDILEAMLDDSNAASRLAFIGHSGPVYNTSFNMDNRLMLSCSEDSTVRLWSLNTWTCLCVYRLCDFPFWDVKFGPYGHYFVTGGSDKCALLWTLDRQQPLRMFVGHDSDVNCVAFHPNSNYVASGSDDKTLRIWDLANGECVRIFNNYTAPIQTVQFSHDGRFLASGSVDGKVVVFDIGQGQALIDPLAAHNDQPVYSLAFSRDNGILASGGADDKISVHNLSNFASEVENVVHSKTSNTTTSDVSLGDYYTKSTSVLHLSFTRRNLLLGAGNFDQ